MLTKPITFVTNWKGTFKIALMVESLLIFIRVFLQPFDTFQAEIEWKALKSSGYALSVIFRSSA